MAGYEIAPSASAVDILRVVSNELSDLVELAQQVLKELTDQRQRGMIRLFAVTITAGAQPSEIEISPSAFSVVIINDGANACQFRLPTEAPWVTINAGETVQPNFPTAVIGRIGFQPTAGNTTLRLITAH